jgi:hypothetical protein
MKSTTHTVVLLIRGIHAPSSTLKEIETDKIDTVLHDMADRFIDGHLQRMRHLREMRDRRLRRRPEDHDKGGGRL